MDYLFNCILTIFLLSFGGEQYTLYTGDKISLANTPNSEILIVLSNTSITNTTAKVSISMGGKLNHYSIPPKTWQPYVIRLKSEEDVITIRNGTLFTASSVMVNLFPNRKLISDSLTDSHPLQNLSQNKVLTTVPILKNQGLLISSPKLPSTIAVFSGSRIYLFCVNKETCSFHTPKDPKCSAESEIFIKPSPPGLLLNLVQLNPTNLARVELRSITPPIIPLLVTSPKE